MNHHATSPSQGLFDAIARSWQLPAVATAWSCSRDGRWVSFARADGAVALAPLADPEPAEARLRVSGDTGRATIQSRRAPPPPLITTEPLGKGAPRLLPHGQAGFLAGNEDGCLVHIAADGSHTPFGPRLDGPVAALSALARGFAAACGEEVLYVSESGALIERIAGLPGPVTSLAAAPDRERLALACSDQVLVLTPGGGAPRVILPGGVVSALRWRRDGAYLACALGEAGLAIVDLARGEATRFGDFPTPVASIDWSEPAQAVLAAGAFRITAWGAAAQERPFRDSRAGALQSGRPSLVPVEWVSAHPTRPIVAGGLVNGQVIVAPVGAAEELPVKPVGASLTLLGWSPGGALLLADAAGGLAILDFPSRLFK
ncbi:WD40 repeat domain-containing protein [Acidisoma sp. 7E03]